MNNLLNIPYIYYINLDRSIERKESIEKHFYDFNIINYERIKAIDIKENQDLSFLKNGLPKNLKPVQAAVIYSHIKAIKKFLSSNDEWAIICEDDASLSFSKYWSFSWNDFFSRIPNNANIVQLAISTRRTMPFDFHLHQRTFWDFGCIAYLINKKQAADIINTYCIDERIDLNLYKITNEYDSDNANSFSQEKSATPEEVVYGINKNTVYSVSIFGYDTSDASLIDQETDDQTLDSHYRALDYWTNKHKNFSIDEFMRF